MKNLRVFGKSYAKVNLTLDVFEKKAGDEFHELETIFHKISLCDEMSLEVADEFEIIGKFSCELDDNLIYKAFLLIEDYVKNYKGNSGDILKFCEEFNLIKDIDAKKFNLVEEFQKIKLPKVKVIIKKNIPEKGGLGGGSSNFASFIKLYFDLFELGEIPREIIENSAKFGKDIKFFLEQNSCSIGIGFGEKLEKLEVNFSGQKIYIYKPNFENSTAEMYKNFKRYNTKFSRKFLNKLSYDKDNLLKCLNNHEVNNIFNKKLNNLKISDKNNLIENLLNIENCGNGFDSFFDNENYLKILGKFWSLEHIKKQEFFPFVMCGSGSCFFSFEKFELEGVKVFEASFL